MSPEVPVISPPQIKPVNDARALLCGINQTYHMSYVDPRRGSRDTLAPAAQNLGLNARNLMSSLVTRLILILEAFYEKKLHRHPSAFSIFDQLPLEPISARLLRALQPLDILVLRLNKVEIKRTLDYIRPNPP